MSNEEGVCGNCASYGESQPVLAGGARGGEGGGAGEERQAGGHRNSLHRCSLRLDNKSLKIFVKMGDLMQASTFNRGVASRTE